MPYQAITHAIAVSVEVEYVPADRHGHGADRHVWAYHIRMENRGAQTVQLRTRHWTITDANGHVEKVDGPGVIGETPVLAPGESFAYTSGCPLATDSGAMSGHYIFVRDDGALLQVTIPAFSLDRPGAKRTLN
jgi:ApaG protein